jgi:hypothetical protein
VIRWRGHLELVLSRYARKPVERDVRYLLWMTLYQVGFMKKAHYHVVKEAVEYARNEKGKFVAGFVNAVLRRSVSDRETPRRVPCRGGSAGLSINGSPIAGR